VSLPSKRCKAVSAILALLALCSICIGPAFAADQPRRTILVFPIESHWLSAPMARQVTARLAEQLGKQNMNVIVFDPASPVFREVLPGPDVPATSMRHDLALAAGAQGSVVGQLFETDTRIELELEFAGAVSHRSKPLKGIAVPESVQPGATAAVSEIVTAVAAQVLAQLLPQGIEVGFWEIIGADEAGQRAGAAERFADGEAALSAGEYPRAAREFEAAIIGDPNRGEYFAAAAEAQAALGHYDRALIRCRRASSLLPKDRGIALRAGDIALLAGSPEQADGIFRGLYDSDSSDLRPLEGMARAARAMGQFDRAVGYYSDLISKLLIGPRSGIVVSTFQLTEPLGPLGTQLRADLAPLARLLAGAPDDTIRLTSVPPDELGRPIGILYLKAGKFAEGVKVLLAYYSLPRGKGERAAWSDADYLSLSAALDEGSRTVAHDVQSQLSASLAGQADADQTASALGNLHTLSDNLATVAEKIQVSAALDPAHRYRVLAYNLLNESNFEAGLYAGTRDPERRRRADLLADAYRKALDQAKELATALLGGEGTK
jgi:tetratricopeptide (TPR) repeat protein